MKSRRVTRVTRRRVRGRVRWGATSAQSGSHITSRKDRFKERGDENSAKRQRVAEDERMFTSLTRGSSSSGGGGVAGAGHGISPRRKNERQGIRQTTTTKMRESRGRMTFTWTICRLREDETTLAGLLDTKMPQVEWNSGMTVHENRRVLRK